MPHPFYKVQVQFPAYIHTLHNPKVKILTISLSHAKAQKLEDEEIRSRKTEISTAASSISSSLRRRKA